LKKLFFLSLLVSVLGYGDAWAQFPFSTTAVHGIGCG
jgi:hypothetical protein